jgi:hypothetical protein
MRSSKVVGLHTRRAARRRGNRIETIEREGLVGLAPDNSKTVLKAELSERDDVPICP